jgi:hypothetical protein
MDELTAVLILISPVVGLAVLDLFTKRKLADDPFWDVIKSKKSIK